MSGYNQPGAKRQKVREGRPGDNVDYFQGIDKVEFSSAAPASDGGYRYYSSERCHSRPLDDWLKCSVCLADFTHASNSHFKSSHCPWDDGSNTVDNHKRCIKALFDFCSKLGIKYWTAFDSDLVPSSDSWDENRQHWDEVVEYIQELNQRYHMKLLWLAPDLHSHPRYASGAFTSSESSTFAQAASQIKKCLEVSQRLNAECFLIWPHREGYDNIFQSDVTREIKIFAKLLKITAEYRERLNYRCQLLMMPYYNCNTRNYSSNFGSWQHQSWRDDVVNRYMWDVTSCLYFLKNYNLERYYKVCSPPGHHMFMASVYNMLGGVVITNDVDHYDTKKFTLMMKCIIDQGNPPAAGINLKLRPRRDSDPRDMVTLYVKYLDALAKGLRFAAGMASEQMFAKHLQQRYASYYSGFGSRLVSADVSMEECEEFYKKNQSPHGEVSSAKHEHFDLMLQRYLDSRDHM
ncbi:hypothetical protein ABMA27_004134 [Loxostege sticticalis]|uniref:Xylose isomerase n=1 Tax=Loxostege sticticalis TaxID=481309 RepID=A0ABR3HMJ5_LOXSC